MTLAFLFGGSPGSGEIILILAVLLLLFGAKKMPGIARNLGHMLEEFRRAARDVTDEILHADTEPSKPSRSGLPKTTPDESPKEKDDGPVG
ncbi:MAG: twin-arginine translocase TatA/TatE family subunit [Spartobacteria bacterium]|nr:twin-arginine translocase TatA/TatE family subunit [Spartobacteria bacterium]